MNATLLTVPQHTQSETVAFERADETADGPLGSVRYVTRNDARRSAVEHRWAASHEPLRLRASLRFTDAGVEERFEWDSSECAAIESELRSMLASLSEC